MNFIIYISPAKKMKDYDYYPYNNHLFFHSEKLSLEKYLLSLNTSELKIIYKASDKIVDENYQLLHQGVKILSPAIFAYDGIQFQTLSPNTLSQDELNYLQKHLFIISGYYGLLKPLDGVSPYRLEMQSKIDYFTYKNLYDFWGDKLFNLLKSESNILINLASDEYNKVIALHQSSDVKVINIRFYQRKNDKLVMQSTEVKASRGDFLRFLAENEIENIEDMKKYCRRNYQYSKELSNPNNIIFIK